MQLDLFKSLSNNPEDTVVTTKICNTCKESKSLTEYGKASGSKTHTLPDCRECNNHKSTTRLLLKKKHPYPDEGYCCPICSKNADALRYKTQPDRKVWCLDHDHITDNFRGYVCFRCNIAVGQVKNDPNIAYSLFEYLKG
jgi:hypothetical protein